MKTTRLYCCLQRQLAASLILICLGTAWALYGQQKPLSQQIVELLQSAEPIAPNTPGQARAGSVEPARASRTAGGYLRSLGAPPGHQFKAKAAVPGQPVETARAFLREHAGLFGVEHPAVEFLHLKSTTAKGRNYVRLQQTYAGVPIFSAEATVQLNGQDGVEFVLCRFASNLKALDEGGLSLAPTITSDSALARVKTLLAAKAGNKPIVTSQPSLALFAPALLNLGGQMRLVWDMNVATEDFSRLNERVLLDAHAGEIVRRYPLNKAALDRVIKDGYNTSDPITVRTEGQGPCGTPQANDVYDYLGDTYNFYHNVLGRDSVDDDGWTLEATVRYCPSGEGCPWGNAH